MLPRLVLTFTLTAFLSSLAVRPLWAQAKYPERPIKLMITFSPGGVNDVVGRHWAERMKPLLGAIFVENQAGGFGGTVAAPIAKTLMEAALR